MKAILDAIRKKKGLGASILQIVIGAVLLPLLCFAMYRISGGFASVIKELLDELSLTEWWAGLLLMLGEVGQTAGALNGVDIVIWAMVNINSGAFAAFEACVAGMCIGLCKNLCTLLGLNVQMIVTVLSVGYTTVLLLILNGPSHTRLS